MTDFPLEVAHASGRVTIRRARADDSELAYRIKCDALEEQLTAIEEWDDAEQWKAHERRFATQDYYLIELDCMVIGVMALAISPDQIRLNQFFVLHNHHGKGVGTAVLRALVAKADASGLPIRLDVMPDNRRAIALYGRFGFRQIEGSTARVAMVRPCDGSCSVQGSRRNAPCLDEERGFTVD